MTAPVLPSQPIPEPVRQHSPLPWRVHGIYTEEIYCTDDGHQFQIADICGAGTVEQDTTNAAFIVEAVNSNATLKADLAQCTEANHHYRDAVDVLESNARVQAKLLADTGWRVKELEGALTDCVGCVAAAETEGLHEVIAELRGFSEQTDRLIDLIERRLLWVRNYGDAALSPKPAAETGR